MVKIGADGTAGTLFSVARSSGQNFSFRLQENPSNDSSGPLADAAGYLVPILPTSSAAEAIYHHPAFVNDTGAHKDLHLQVVDNATATVLGNYPIQAVRPPLLLVHGLWSTGEEAFLGLRTKLVEDGLYESPEQIRYADYPADQSFAANASRFKSHVSASLQNYSNQKISVSKVDLVGHSMGGLLSRQYIQGPDYRQDVNRLITLNTPHSGSPIPNFINSLSTTARVGLVGALIFLGYDPTNGAVADLSYNSPAIARLNASPNTKGVGLHTITTYVTLTPQLPVEQLLNGQFSWGGLLVGWMALTNPERARDINAYLFNSVYHNYSDLIVGQNSQRGGLGAPYTNNLNDFPNQWHSSGSSPTVQNEIKALLLAKSNSAQPMYPFTTGNLIPPVISSVFPREALATMPTVNPSSTLRITSPTRGTIATDLDSIQVTVAASADVTRVLLLCATGTPEIASKLLPGAGGTTYIKVPKHGLGRLKITALAFADSIYVQSDTLTTRLTTLATLTGLRVEPNLVYTSVGDSTPVRVTGMYSDGVYRNILGQPSITFTFPSGNARTRRNGWVVGVRAGLDSMRVAYAGRTVTKLVQVVAPLPLAAASFTAPSHAVQVWPNPAQRTVRVRGGSGSINILDLVGRVVCAHPPVHLDEEAILDLQGVPPGTYIVRVGAATRRLLVN
ncbi:hypothetical protein MTX78_23600 (plasmid) [Hymenobacter tibetensis]|uniref:GPI inositol-deacylase PGAP1-like alpha/beta domain-containing protein n=1 Tax=Hymenobacter tibetensis TaxID=497967 RepID=A0ABY4D5W2_9BACT|nr:hypothetical protein [Hymenobacter tibetensis]UOG77424.1 hypothetical protein MTX78_23600 [Hymenobacter tibetensis]